MVKGDEGRGGDEVIEMWEWAGMAANEQARKHEWGGDYTLEEIEGGIENVVTGLSDESDEEEGEQQDKSGEVEDHENKKPEEGGAKPLSMDEMLRFLVKGEEPKK